MSVSYEEVKDLRNACLKDFIFKDISVLPTLLRLNKILQLLRDGKAPHPYTSVAAMYSVYEETITMLLWFIVFALIIGIALFAYWAYGFICTL